MRWWLKYSHSLVSAVRVDRNVQVLELGVGRLIRRQLGAGPRGGVLGPRNVTEQLLDVQLSILWRKSLPPRWRVSDSIADRQERRERKEVPVGEACSGLDSQGWVSGRKWML